MRTTTAWVLQREPALVRAAPLVVVVVVAGLGIWLATARVAVYDTVTARVSHVHRGVAADTLDIQLDGAVGAPLHANSAVFVTPAESRERIDASVVSMDENAGRARLSVAAASTVDAGAVTVRFATGQRSLLSQLVGTARAEGRKP